jgi:hypothetical protein
MSQHSQESETQTCNTCLEEKPLTSFKINGVKKDGSKYRTKKCRECLDIKKSVLCEDDRVVVIRALAIAERALGITDKVLEMTKS